MSEVHYSSLYAMFRVHTSACHPSPSPPAHLPPLTLHPSTASANALPLQPPHYLLWTARLPLPPLWRDRIDRRVRVNVPSRRIVTHDLRPHRRYLPRTRRRHRLSRMFEVPRLPELLHRADLLPPAAGRADARLALLGRRLDDHRGRARVEDDEGGGGLTSVKRYKSC